MSNTVCPQGQCLCGEVQISLADIKPEIGVCHCQMCQQWSGGPFMSIAAGDKIEIKGKSSISVYNSSDWAERAFCKNCGSHLYYRLKGNNSYHVVVGLLDKEPSMVLHHELFIDNRPDFYSFTQDTEKYTASETFALFANTD